MQGHDLTPTIHPDNPSALDSRRLVPARLSTTCTWTTRFSSQAAAWRDDRCRSRREVLCRVRTIAVDFVSTPKDQFYGVEAVFKYPFGNWFSMSQPKNY
jgi:hypothetical protein